MSYRNDVDALAARHTALEFEVVEKTKERNAAASLLAEAKARAKLPVLDNIRVATPCNVDWNEMTGDERVRACASCNKNVYNLSSMTRDEAETLIVAKEGSLCVRYYQRHDGTILLADCSIGISQKRKRRVIAAGAAALLAGTALFAWKLPRSSHTNAKDANWLMGQSRIELTTSVAGGIGPMPQEVVAGSSPSPPTQSHESHESNEMSEVKGRMSGDPSMIEPVPVKKMGLLKHKVSKPSRSGK